MKKKQINNRYEILRSLGEGGMGQVSLVADLQEEGREVALKSFRPVSTGGDELDLEQYKPGAAPLVVALSAEQIETEIGLLLCMHRVLGTPKAKSQPMLDA